MRFDEIEANKTYYHPNKVIASAGRSDKHYRSHYVYRILKKDDLSKHVYASCNGLPPKFFGPAYYKNWQRERPMDLKLSI
jgi:hypothetical protein